MSEAAVVINVSNQPQIHSNGLSGTWIVPPAKPSGEFGMLVVYPTPEIQDIGEGRKTVHWLKALPLAKDIVGLRSDAAAHSFGATGTKEKWGLLLCELEPEVPRELLKAQEEEMEFLNNNLPEVRYRKHKESGASVAVNVEDESVREMKQKLSEKVQELRAEFEADCRKGVKKSEIERAKKALLMEDQRLIAEADQLWQQEATRRNINELHRAAVNRMGQERPYCFIPQQLVDCPGCGTKIKENILSCPSCQGWLDEGIEELRKMTPKARAMKMYPERYEKEAPAATK